jgi:hypothetical protein
MLYNRKLLIFGPRATGWTYLVEERRLASSAEWGAGLPSASLAYFCCGVVGVAGCFAGVAGCDFVCDVFTPESTEFGPVLREA